VLLFVGDGPHALPAARFDLRQVARVFSNRGVRLANFGYFGHMWELYAMWTWAPIFLRASLGERGAPASLAEAAVFVVIGAGAVGCVAAGLWADRVGRTAVTSIAMCVSGACCVAVGFLYGAHPALLLGLAAVWGASVVADSAQFSTCVTELGDPRYMGTALTVQTCCGFLLTTASIHLIPRLAEAFGWRYAFAALAPGPLLGIVAMLRLRALPESAKIAGGRK
jgi:MFS family permease